MLVGKAPPVAVISKPLVVVTGSEPANVVGMGPNKSVPIAVGNTPEFAAVSSPPDSETRAPESQV